MKQREVAVLNDILLCIQLIRDFVGIQSRLEFDGDSKTQSAVLHQLLILGEAVKRLPPEFTKRYGQIPWSAIAGMRNRLIHEYHDVDLDEVWNTIQKDLAPLETEIEKIISITP